MWYDTIFYYMNVNTFPSLNNLKTWSKLKYLNNDNKFSWTAFRLKNY